MSSTPNEAYRARHWACALQLTVRRHQLGLTQQDVVDRLAELGVSASNRMLSAMEHGQGIDVARLPELAIALDCTVTYLLGLTSSPWRWEPDDGALTAALAEPVGAEVTANPRPGLRRFAGSAAAPSRRRGVGHA